LLIPITGIGCVDFAGTATGLPASAQISAVNFVTVGMYYEHILLILHYDYYN